MAKNIFSEAKALRKKHPRKFREWSEYVDWATELHHSKSHSPAKKKIVKKKSARKPRGRKVSGTAAPKTVGTVAYHKKQAHKQVEEQLAWLLLARDSEKRVRERKKLSKKVNEKRAELKRLS